MKKQDFRFRKANPVSISSVLSPVLNELNCGDEYYFWQLKKQWKDIVGDTNARNTRPVFLKDGIITVTVSSPVWLNELRFAKKKLLEKINEFESINKVNVRDIRFTLERFR